MMSDEERAFVLAVMKGRGVAEAERALRESFGPSITAHVSKSGKVWDFSDEVVRDLRGVARRAKTA